MQYPNSDTIFLNTSEFSEINPNQTKDDNISKYLHHPIIKEINKRLELDKSWETSWTRRICIMILTYIVVIIYSNLIRNNNNIYLSSLVPVIGFTLSTLSLKLVRRIWEKI